LNRRFTCPGVKELRLPLRPDTGSAASIGCYVATRHARARLPVVVPDRRTILVEENRRGSLGLAVNWGFRFLHAYALEIKPSRTRDRTMRDLQWVHSLIGR